MFEERPISWSHLIDAEKQVSSLAAGEWNWPSPEPDETSCVITFKPGLPLKGRNIRNWLHDTYIGECVVIGCYWEGGVLPLAIRYRFPTFDDKLLFTLRWF